MRSGSSEPLGSPYSDVLTSGMGGGTKVPGKLEPLQLAGPLEPLPDCPVRADIIKWALPGLGVMSGRLCGLRQVAQARGSVSSGEDDLLLGVNLRGCSTAHQGGRELKLQNGDAVLATRGLTGFTITRPTPVRFIGFRVLRDAIAPLAGRLDEAPIRVVPHGTETLNLLVNYAGAIADKHPPQTPELQRLVVTHIHDLIAATVGATRDGWAIAEGCGIRAARLRAIMADITANLYDCDLTVAAVARRQRVTPRYVHKLFEGEGLTFSAFVRRSKSLEVLIPILYLKGISTGDFEEALAALVGKNAPGLSASTIARLKEVWTEEHARWQKRDLSAKRYVYCWADGIHLEARLEEQAQCILVIIGATPEGKKELVGFTDGMRESSQSWRDLLLDLKRRGLTTAPQIAVADGALGFWKALGEVWPTTREQR
jgi:mutator family transposase